METFRKTSSCLLQLVNDLTCHVTMSHKIICAKMVFFYTFFPSFQVFSSLSRNGNLSECNHHHQGNTTCLFAFADYYVLSIVQTNNETVLPCQWYKRFFFQHQIDRNDKVWNVNVCLLHFSIEEKKIISMRRFGFRGRKAIRLLSDRSLIYLILISSPC